jgi:23S rRNA (guanine745-N1)-methyltransferase
MTEILSIINCPVCGGTLIRENKSLVCPHRHTFDIAKQGYVNLLPPGKEKNAHTGDEQVMVKAIVDFLSRGYYKNISDRLAELITEHIPTDTDAVLCDMGCGEGYHTTNIADGVHRGTGKPVLAVGFDASKHAAVYSSRLSRSLGMMPKDGVGAEIDSHVQTYFMPANIFRLPICDSSVGAAVSMFAPIAWDEVKRVLKPGGILAVVSSGRDHLIEMRNLIYDEVRLSDFEPEAAEGFSLVASDELCYETIIETNDDIRNLFMMTPFYYKTTEAGRERLYSKESLKITVNVNYSIFKVD